MGNKILEVQGFGDVPGHSMFGDWALPGRKYSYLALLDLAKKHMPERKPQKVDFNQICWKPADWLGGDDFSGKRFDMADTKYPGLLVRDMPNPCDRPFRMVDGRRRLEKMQRQGLSAGWYFIFEYSEAEPFIRDFIAAEAD
ncbi:MAG: hypothetical protein HOF74_09680 [Gammaproteobacteria bacterium]|jgi:hypothetical protein|nr:hypothetical protein [Gammaproteobacteria bacterium]MBT3860088.1 hypothetical protein [Gammaproteobacteria bacterium]MBT3987380.1 hypothetical protein [Gammaproteobacteria bacterium]MBT4581882.1 hypothetical protein [Gammaproteobacteria bacterium]MBT4659742.1 hypothetical protein [Gammaproteobacteria bacterium]